MSAELYRASEHEPLAAEPWDEVRVEAAIDEIVVDAETAFDGGRWPHHPLDDEDDASTTVYMGAAGVVWALHELGSGGWRDTASLLVDRYEAQPDGGAHAAETSYWLGECGIALVGYRLSGDGGLADRVEELVRANLANPTNEVMWGAPGSLLATEAMGAWSGEEHWFGLWHEVADHVLAVRGADGLWVQELYGRSSRILGPAHGSTGVLRALRNGGLDVELDLAPYALYDGPLANWLPSVESEPDRVRVQWCHGAPGIVATMGDALPLELARAGAELTWRAGPLAKGPGLCHGTAGNGYAFLSLYRRTGESMWLDRARAFAMHAISQVETARAKLGRGRYSLFTGDVGVALYARDCLEGEDRFPTMGPFA